MSNELETPEIEKESVKDQGEIGLKCPNCGKSLPIQFTKFCTSCGTDLSSLEISQFKSDESPNSSPERYSEEQNYFGKKISDFNQSMPRTNGSTHQKNLKETLENSIEELIDSKSIKQVAIGIGFLALILAIISSLIGNYSYSFFNNAFKSFLTSIVDLTRIFIYLVSAWVVFSFIKTNSNMNWLRGFGKPGLVIVFLVSTWLLSSSIVILLHDVTAFRFGFNASTGIQFFGGILEIAFVLYILNLLLKHKE